MISIEDINKLVKEYCSLYRATSLDDFQFFGAYVFNKQDNISPVIPEYSWPEKYPTKEKRGIYIVFSFDELLYIGKASQQPIKNRMGNYFKHSSDKTYGIPKGKWSKKPTHYFSWTVPTDSFFEASALEEYLIYKLKNHLPDNSVGK